MRKAHEYALNRAKSNRLLGSGRPREAMLGRTYQEMTNVAVAGLPAPR
jgi:hypothetical protein